MGQQPQQQQGWEQPQQPAPQPQNRAQPQYNEPPAGFDDRNLFLDSNLAASAALI